MAVANTEVGCTVNFHIVLFSGKMRENRISCAIPTLGKFKKDVQWQKSHIPIMQRLPENQRWLAIGALQTGSTQVNVARRLGVSQSVVSRLWNRYRNYGTVADLPRSGRPRATTYRQDRLIVIEALRNRTQNATRLQQRLRQVTGTRVATQTVRNRLHDAQLNARRPTIVLPLTLHHRQARRAWSRRHIRWTMQQWRSVMFSDESRFTLDFNDGRVRVWRRRGERHRNVAMVPHNRYGGGSVMVWAGITMNDRTDLHVCQGNMTGVYYRDNIVEPIVVPFAQRHGPGFVFQDDNARPHRARVVLDHLQRRQINNLPWPARSPDLSPIEHLWDILGRRVRGRQVPPRTLGQLAQALQEEWHQIPQNAIRRLILSMRRRCNACLQAEGGPTRY